ncbi:flagellar hook-length control protein FliK [Sphingomonas sp. PvP055]|uniref:flagellar hook-length control protein FliK n=1 Tax=Sphingomonas sp. PvP055 TaxID=3156391 RepID=UPI00339AC3EB
MGRPALYDGATPGRWEKRVPPVAAVSNLSSPAVAPAAEPGTVPDGAFQRALGTTPDTTPATLPVPAPVTATIPPRDTPLTIAATIAAAGTETARGIGTAVTPPTPVSSPPPSEDIAPPSGAPAETGGPARASGTDGAVQPVVRNSTASHSPGTPGTTDKTGTIANGAAATDAAPQAADATTPAPVDAAAHDSAAAPRTAAPHRAKSADTAIPDEIAPPDSPPVAVPNAPIVAPPPPVPAAPADARSRPLPDTTAAIAAHRGDSSGGMPAALSTSPASATDDTAMKADTTFLASPSGDQPSKPSPAGLPEPQTASPPAPAAVNTTPTPPAAPVVPPAQAPAAQPGVPPPAIASPRRTIDAGTARAAVIGRDVALAIARHAKSDGANTLTIRLDPVELGRVEVRMQIDATGKLTATVSAEHASALDLLRRDSAMLAQTLSQAGVQADAGSFRFDTQSGGNGAGPGSGSERGWAFAAPSRSPDDEPDDSRSAPSPTRPGLRASGRINLVA